MSIYTKKKEKCRSYIYLFWASRSASYFWLAIQHHALTKSRTFSPISVGKSGYESAIINDEIDDDEVEGRDGSTSDGSELVMSYIFLAAAFNGVMCSILSPACAGL